MNLAIALADYERKCRLSGKRPWLVDRLKLAKEYLCGVDSDYRIVWENGLDSCCKTTRPDPNWLAAALHGSVLPPIDAYLKDQELEEQYQGCRFQWGLQNRPLHPYAKPIGPMTEEEAIEYLVKRALPRHVWDDRKSNRPKFKICKVQHLPQNKDNRASWSLSHA